MDTLYCILYAHFRSIGPYYRVCQYTYRPYPAEKQNNEQEYRTEPTSIKLKSTGAHVTKSRESHEKMCLGQTKMISLAVNSTNHLIYHRWRRTK